MSDYRSLNLVTERLCLIVCDTGDVTYEDRDTLACHSGPSGKEGKYGTGGGGGHSILKRVYE